MLDANLDESTEDEDEATEDVDPMVLALQAAKQNPPPPPAQQQPPAKRPLVTQPRVASKRTRLAGIVPDPEVVDLTGQAGGQDKDPRKSLADDLYKQAASGTELSGAQWNFLMLQQMAAFTSNVSTSLLDRASSSSDKSAKTKQLEQDMKQIEYDEEVRIKDNGVDQIDLEWRHRLKIPNSNPGTCRVWTWAGLL